VESARRREGSKQRILRRKAAVPAARLTGAARAIFEIENDVVDTGHPQAIEEAKQEIAAGAISEMNGLWRHVRIIAQIEVE